MKLEPGLRFYVFGVCIPCILCMIGKILCKHLPFDLHGKYVLTGWEVIPCACAVVVLSDMHVSMLCLSNLLTNGG